MYEEWGGVQADLLLTVDLKVLVRRSPLDY